MKKALLLVSLMLSVVFAALAQERTVSGVIKDPAGETLPGVAVVVKGTTQGTVTGMDGAYRLITTVSNPTLVFKLVGYKTQEVQVGTQSAISITLQEDVEQLSEVVVIGYGTTEKTSFTGSATTVDSEQIENIQTSTPLAALEGSVPGLQMTGVSGQPGSNPSINIRGFSSLNHSNDPLIIVDGAPYDGNLNAINPKDIASYSVLKDASGTAIYGSRATNGVIMITTKNGKSSKPKVDLSVRKGVSQRAFKEYDRVNAPEYYEAMFEGLKNSRISNGESDEDARAFASRNLIYDYTLQDGAGGNGILGGYNAYNVPSDQVVGIDGKINPNAQLIYNDDFQDELFGNGARDEYNLAISGANEKSDYFISLGYLNEEGIVDNSGFEKITTRLKVNSDVSSWFKLGANLNYGYTESKFMGATGTATSNPFFSSRMIGPIYPVYLRDDNGNIVYEDGAKVFDFGAGEYNGAVRPYGPNSNIVATTNLDYNQTNRHSVGARGFAQITFLKDFKFTTNISTDIYAASSLENQNSEYGDAVTSGGRSTKSTAINTSYTFNQVLNYQKAFDNHSINVTLGHEAYKYSYDYMTGTRTGFPVSGLLELGAASNTEDLNSYVLDHSIQSYFGRVEYNYDQKYFISGSLRRDGTSRFAPESRWGTFYSLGASWRISQEDFMKNISWLNELKLRGSHGVLGNESILKSDNTQNYYPWQSVYSLSGQANGAISGGNLEALGNRNLQWEKNINSNIAVDFTLLNRVNGTVEYYVKKSDDLIMDKPLNGSLGYDFITTNIGELTNKGIEVSLNVDVIKKADFNWNVGFIWSKVNNEITNLNGIEPFVMGNKYIEEGASIFDFYLVESAGVDPSTGDELYWQNELDDEGNPTGERFTTSVYNDAQKDSRKRMESSIPDFQGSITNSLYYKGFDFSMLMIFSKGGKIYDATYARLMNFDPGSALHRDAYERAWRQEGDITDVPRLEHNNNDLNRPSSRFLTDATYFGIRNMTLGYTLSNNLASKLKIGSLRAYVTADNIWYTNERQGLFINPARNGNTSYGYVPVRTISFGIDLSI
ncbi:TonB-dependent receptor [Flammeovirga sp. EKP202]|uniref:SusC/RagA family TonB-linked outer membrane protein n=1 Tax=Flammeovirga sp. EKP202 TaxID=2770592 RepID=UPI00166006A9|nr:TonB-dependent receptor [Flammeovirga sp. EKP202]MBD0404163.1 TonB-dependent receptor [Flammeovirga sp. EKP202]